MADQKPQIAGPPAPRSKYDNLPALPRRTPEEDKPDTLKDVILPILLAQGMDMLSTEEPIGFLRRDDLHEKMNKFPGARAQGFGGTLGRMGSGAAELGLAAILSKFGLGRAYAIPSISTHSKLAQSNLDYARERDAFDKLRRR